MAGRPGRVVLGGPAAGDELAVPAQDRGRGDEQPEASADGSSRVRAAITARSVQRIRGRGVRRLQHGELVTQDQDLDLLGGVGSSAQRHPAQERGEHPVDQHQRHRRIMLGCGRRRTGRSAGVRGFGHPQGAGDRAGHDPHPGRRVRQVAEAGPSGAGGGEGAADLRAGDMPAAGRRGGQLAGPEAGTVRPS